MSESPAKLLIIIARSYIHFRDYCAKNKINPRGGRDAVYVSSEDRDSHRRIQGLLFKREQVIVLDAPRSGRTLDMLVYRILRAEGEIEGKSLGEQQGEIIDHLKTEVWW